MKQSLRTDIVIVGGGIVGLTSAFCLVKSGAEVVLIDKSARVREASWASAGMLSPLKPWRTPSDTLRLARSADQVYRHLSRQLAEQTGLDAGFGEGGTLFLRHPDARFRRWADERERSGEGLWLNHGQMRQLLGTASPASAKGFWLANGCTLHSPRFCRALLQWLCLQGSFTLAAPQTVRALCTERGRVTGLEMDGGSWRAEHYLIAAGAWTGQLVPQLANCVYPVRGQILAYRTGRGSAPVSISAGDSYAVVRRDGLVLVGSTVERAGYNCLPTRAGYELLMRWASRLMPALAGVRPAYHWAGLRPGAAFPLIGRMPDCDNLWVNTGHFRQGIACAPASAALCAALLLGQKPALHPAPYDPARLL